MKSYINAVWNDNDYNKNNYKAVNNKVEVLGSVVANTNKRDDNERLNDD